MFAQIKYGKAFIYMILYLIFLQCLLGIYYPLYFFKQLIKRRYNQDFSAVSVKTTRNLETAAVIYG
jgi:hypothetical protein